MLICRRKRWMEQDNPSKGSKWQLGGITHCHGGKGRNGGSKRAYESQITGRERCFASESP